MDFLDVTYKAGGDLSTKQYYFVKFSAAKTVVVCTGTTDIPVGVLQNKPESGEAAVVRRFGRTKVIADAALTYDDQVGTSADGQAAPYLAGTDTTKRIMGDVETPADNAGEVAEIFLHGGNSSRAA